MGLYDKLLKDGRLYKAIPRNLGDKEFLTVVALDPRYGEDWKELGIGCFHFIEEGRVRTIWHHSNDVTPYPIALREGDLFKLEIKEDRNFKGVRVEVVGALDSASLQNYHFARLVPEAIEPEIALVAKKK